MALPPDRRDPTLEPEQNTTSPIEDERSYPKPIQTEPDTPPPSFSIEEAPPPWYSRLPATEHLKFFLETNWTNTPLGLLETWSQALQLYTLMLMTDSQPACLYAGEQKIAIYNAAFAPFAGKTHPGLMGSAFKKNLPYIADPIQLKFDEAEKLGYAVPVADFQLFIERKGLLEETYFTGTFNPLRGLDGKIEAIHNSVREVTRQILDDRRAAMVNRHDVSTVLRAEHLAAAIIPLLQMNKLDITMALLYEMNEDVSPESSHLILRGQIGVPAGHSLALENVDLYGIDDFAVLLRKARDGGKILTHPVDEIFSGIDWQGFGEPSKHFSILPLSGMGKLYGFLVVGANPRRPIDDDHHRFMTDIASFVTYIAASMATVEETQKRNMRLEKQVAASEKKLRFMAQNASVGMLQSAPDGSILWANEQYYNLTGRSDQDQEKSKATFLESFIDEDYSKARETWTQLQHGEPSVAVELHLKRLFVPPTGDPEPSVILAHSFPYLEDGKVVSIMTIMQDISALRRAEQIQARRALAAAEEKKKTEDFMDMVSHEMRNPLSAIYNSADVIMKSLNEVENHGITENRLLEALRSNVKWAKTIMSAAKLQKCIVDDILTLSKLQYELISIKPQPMQLPSLVETTVKMFESDMIAHRIQGTTTAQLSLKTNDADWVLCDPSRLTQVLVNFLTNSIKFTKNEKQREIVVEYGVTSVDPRKSFPSEIHWAPTDPEIKSQDISIGSKKVFLCISVKDTGVGMTDDERQRLFNRFAQASATTSIKYGGTGLGLFISKRLTEKLGGEIGVYTAPGVGSTFAFYVEAETTLPESFDTAVIDQKFPLAVRTMSGAIDGVFPADSSHIHVLVVEDNEINLKMLARQLTQAGCIVSVASDGADALLRMRETDLCIENTGGKHFDIVLMDWEMPVMDGLTACREVRASEKNGEFIRHIEIIITTAHAREQHKITALEAGADAVISKPFLIGDLLTQMRARLSAPPVSASPPTIRTFSEP